MPGGLMQLVGVGAQNELVNGNPSMTHFRSVYRRHTNFAMEQIRMPFTASNLEFSTTGTRTISCRIDRYAQLLHDSYLIITLPDIWSPLKYLNTAVAPTGYDARTNSIGYEFQWIPNIGYNLIDHVNLVMNGQVIQSLRGEWLKMYSYMTHDANKRKTVDQMVGNVPQIYDPAHAYDRDGQYPHAIAPTVLPTTAPQTKIPEPSIRSRQLVIPLHFWFCENPGMALPLVSLQNSEVYIEVTLRQLSDLYTVVDTTSTSLTYGKRVRPVNYPLSLFLSPPLSTGLPSNSTITTWFPDPYIEGNFIYLTEMEMNQLARADQSFLVKTVKYVNKEGQFGGNTDLEIPMFNLVTRIVFSSQRSDRILLNDWDNYTNWTTVNRAPWSAISTDVDTALYSSGQQQVTSVYPRDSMTDGVILFDGKERIQPKPLPFFSLLQMYRHTTGETTALPGVYMYSFALDNTSYQPSGAANGSMFNKIILRLTLQQPLPLSVTPTTSTTVCVLTSTLFSPNPTIIPAANVNLIDAQTGKLLYPPGTITTVVQTNDNILFTFTYNVGVYVESINFFRIVSGLGNLVFAS
jgi:Major capsid protein N-terminus/Large eukaryotic DNA virus major capsid protein